MVLLQQDFHTDIEESLISDIFNMDRMRIAAQSTMDLLVTYEPNDSDDGMLVFLLKT